MHGEADLAGTLCQSTKLPFCTEALERAIHQTHGHRLVRHQFITGSKGISETGAAECQLAYQNRLTAFQHLRCQTAMHKFRITLDIVHQSVHLRCCVWHQCATLDFYHICSLWETSILRKDGRL